MQNTTRAYQTVKEWAREHKMCLPTAYAVVKSPGFPAVRATSRGKYLIDVEDAENWLREWKNRR